jgi:hypothetical protein
VLFATAVAATPPRPAEQLRLDMRMLWEEHITYTRNYIISALGDLPDQDAVAKRLLRNQDDIGNAIKPYYGEDAWMSAFQSFLSLPTTSPLVRSRCFCNILSSADFGQAGLAPLRNAAMSFPLADHFFWAASRPVELFAFAAPTTSVAIVM